MLSASAAATPIETVNSAGGPPARLAHEFRNNATVENKLFRKRLPLGVHGWFLQNQEAKPIIVLVRMSGFYDGREALPRKSE
jgi:hypothetical protein